MNGSLPRLVRYRVRVAARLDARWTNWFDGFALSAGQDGTTTLSGAVTDQAELHGLLTRIRDLGVDLISVEVISTRPTSSTAGE